MKLRDLPKAVCLLLALAAVAGCASLPLRSFQPFRPKPPLRLYVFDCGTIRVTDVSAFSPGVDVGEERLLANSCYLVRHPKGLLLWDTGLPDSLGAGGQEVPAANGAFFLRVVKPFARQLEEIGVVPSDIRFLAFSHMHLDHAGNGDRFASPNITLLLQEAEYAAAFGPEPATYRFNPATYGKLASNPALRLAGDHDVFGDGSVVILAAPGHTPGHQVLFVDLPKSGPVVLSGDLYHFAKNRTYRRVPSFNFDREATLKSMARIEAFVAEREARLWIQHDYEANASIAHAPAFHE